MIRDEFNLASAVWSAATKNGLPTASEIVIEQSAIGASPGLDHAKYMHELEGLDLTDAQKRELLDTVWSIMTVFVEWGYTMDVSACGQDQNSSCTEPELTLNDVDYEHVTATPGKKVPVVGKDGPS